MSQLVVPLDLTKIPARERAHLRVKVAVRQGERVQSQTVSAEDAQRLTFDVDPEQSATVAVGSDDISDERLFHFQTLTAQVPSRNFAKGEYTLAPLVVTPRWWRLWLGWCRDFVIEGTVVCADGSPVPGAEVRAFDVDYIFWWSSVNQVGPVAVTDANGYFRIEFRWCCGWWPWWWWRLRAWRLDPLLVEKIYPALRLHPELKVREPGPTPTADIFDIQSLSTALQERDAAPAPTLSAARSSLSSVSSQPKFSAALATTRDVTDPSLFSNLRDHLVRVLPPVSELERLRIWPWWPWTPWLDCRPDIIFKVTQTCGGGEAKTIVDENLFDTRWDIPTNLNVTLVANEDACCIKEPDPDPEGDCAVFTSVCGVHVNNIGGNSSAPAAPVGYAAPGHRDRPFSEGINLHGQFGSSAQADFYGIEFADHGVGNWAPVPPAALLGFNRGYFDATQPWPNQWFYPGFNPTAYGPGVHLYESRRHYEDTHPPANWGTAFGRSWFHNLDLLAPLQTSGNFADGTYDFRLVGYQDDGSGAPDLSTYNVLPGCGGDPNNTVAVRIDNRFVGPQVPNTVHVSTNEPDCGITDVRLDGATVAPCGAQELEAGTPLEIDFFVTDPDGHLDHYELVVRYDLGSFKNLLDAADVGAFTLTNTSGGQPGPDYADAMTVGQGGARPTWDGGQLRLRINDASLVFPKTCCYLIQLTCYKRNIVNCSGHLAYYNQMHYSFTVTV